MGRSRHHSAAVHGKADGTVQRFVSGITQVHFVGQVGIGEASPHRQSFIAQEIGPGFHLIQSGPRLILRPVQTVIIGVMEQPVAQPRLHRIGQLHGHDGPIAAGIVVGVHVQDPAVRSGSAFPSSSRRDPLAHGHDAVSAQTQ